jgi:methylthioribose-1-phosphate isomerase
MAVQPTAKTTTIQPLRWHGAADGWLELLDQTLLPAEVVWLAIRDVEALFEAIRSLRVRGAPAIGCAAAYGVVLGLRGAIDATWGEAVRRACARLAESRPTAVNLFWALRRMQGCAERLSGADLRSAARGLLAEAHAIRDEDAAMCRAIGRHGAHLIRDGMGVLTHCNAGALATSEYGTALAVLYTAHEAGRHFRVFVDETRPLLQGSRLTAWELAQAGIDVTLICDSTAARVMREGRVQMVITGADRIAANGDTANKIGTYGVAVLAKSHGVPFFVAAPSSTFDLDLPDGSSIPIEERSAEEIKRGMGRQTAPDEVECYNPAFDITPAELIAGIICERGLIGPVNAPTIAKVLRRKD